MQRKSKKKQELTIVKQTFPIVVQKWADCEGQNIITEAGFSVHLNEYERNTFVDNFWETEKQVNRGQMPQKYLREIEAPFTKEAKEKVYNKLVGLRSQRKHGYWITNIELLIEEKS